MRTLNCILIPVFVVFAVMHHTMLGRFQKTLNKAKHQNNKKVQDMLMF
jgi:hypothetical protein